MYDNMGYIYNEKQKRFMEHYAFLEIHYTHPIWSEDMVINLNPMKAQDEISMDVVEEYNNFLEDQLLIIGEIEKENMTLFFSEKGFFTLPMTIVSLIGEIIL
ncbi:MAG: SUKH-3 domain-containing protein [Lachnospiraceae bacterium]|nr:SUKH-3 domain-containing protein [Lachnospiraceae bacterium]